MARNSLDKQTLNIFWRTTLQAKRRYRLLALLYPAGQIFIYMLAPLFIGKTLASLTQTNGDPWRFLPYFIAAAVIGTIFNRYGFSNMLRTQAETMGRLQTMALEVLLKRSTGFHNNNIGGKLVSDALDYPVAFSLLSGAFLVDMAPFLIVLLSGTVLIFLQSWVLGLTIASMAILAIGSGIYESNRRSGMRARRQISSKAVTAHLADTVVNIPTVKTFAGEDREMQNHLQLNDKLLDLRMRDWVSGAMGGNRRIAMLFIMQLVFLLAAIHQVQQNPDLLGLSIFGFSFSVMLSNRLFEVSSMLRNIEDGLLQAQPMTEIIMQDVEILDKPGAKELKTTHGAIDLINVNFEYRDSDNSQSVFNGLNLSVKPGERIGLVGPSGGGKSTLTRLLLRFDDINSGQIMIDGQNIADVTQTSLRQNISYVPQEPLMFHRSIHDNIAYGHPNASTKDIKSAAKAAHASDFIDELPKGYDTIVGERGVKLSGGQRQRVAIARAILKDAPILVLDEATSALDSESEVFIQDALWKLMQGRTALVIAHRLSTIQRMDRIIVLDKGQIVEQGTHKQLLQNKGLYAKLWKHQSGGFLED